MRYRDSVILAKFSHEWAGYLLLGGLALGIVLVVVSIWHKRFEAKEGRPRQGWPWALLIATRVVFGLGILANLFGMMHFGCAGVVAGDTSCLSNLSRLGESQSLYAADHDDMVAVSPGWLQAVGRYVPPPRWGRDSDVTKCPAAEGSVSYAVNATLAGIKGTEVQNPSDVLMIFESDRTAVGGPDSVAWARHRYGRAHFAFLDGHAKKISREYSAKLSWIPKTIDPNATGASDRK